MVMEVSESYVSFIIANIYFKMFPKVFRVLSHIHTEVHDTSNATLIISFGTPIYSKNW